jgi:predicted O-linked N-acetylglucosamine transferase (SPINDLY family)
VDPARLRFMPKLAHADYLARYRHADLFLDTHPYNAHTTASDALWAGCPLLICPGTTFAARVAGSLNHHLGMDAMNVADDDAFIAKAVQLGRDPVALHALRDTLQQRRASAGLFDMQGFAADFAALLRGLAHERGWQNAG